MELFKLFGTIAVNNSDANAAIDETVDRAEDSQSKLSGAFGKIGKGAAVVGKAIGAGLAAGGAAIGKVTKDAVEAYANYEQLVGGVETLFGDSAKAVMNYADNAYKTAGMSANSYMETVTGFSASLLQSLGGDTAAAAEKANLALIDMSDNANKMGSDMESIKNAYGGFAKQNFTMLDNLKLGYGGTKEEMERLLADAQAISGVEYDVSSYADVVDAIHVIQTEMGITGTTAKEASTTISGSLASMKSAWENLLVGLADDGQNFEALLQNFIDSAVTVVGNLLPRIQIVFDGIPKLIEGLVPQIPPMIQAILPGLIEGAIALVDGLVSALPQILDALKEIIPILLTGIATITASLMEALPDIITSIVSFLTDAGNIQILIEAAITMLTAIITAIPEIAARLVEAAPQIIEGIIVGLFNAVPKLLSSIGEILLSFLNAFLSFFGIASPSKLMEEKAGFIVDGLINGLKAIPEKAAEIFNKMKEKIVKVFDAIKNAGSNFAKAFKDNLSKNFTAAKDTAVKIFTSIKDNIKKIIEGARDVVKNAIEKIKSFFKFEWKLPKLKLPHISIKGEFSLVPPSVPKFSIDWYKNGGIMTQPTLFDFNPASGRAKVGGEAGDEAIAPIDTLLGYVRTAVQEETGNIAYSLDRLISMLAEYFPEILSGMNRNLVLDSGTLVGQLAPAMDSKLGDINELRKRGK